MVKLNQYERLSNLHKGYSVSNLQGFVTFGFTDST